MNEWLVTGIHYHIDAIFKPKQNIINIVYETNQPIALVNQK